MTKLMKRIAQMCDNVRKLNQTTALYLTHHAG